MPLSQTWIVIIVIACLTVVSGITVAIILITKNNEVSCKINQFLVDNTCKDCPTNEFSFGGTATECKSCPTGFTYSNLVNFCIPETATPGSEPEEPSTPPGIAPEPPSLPPSAPSDIEPEPPHLPPSAPPDTEPEPPSLPPSAPPDTEPTDWACVPTTYNITDDDDSYDWDGPEYNTPTYEKCIEKCYELHQDGTGCGGVEYNSSNKRCKTKKVGVEATSATQYENWQGCIAKQTESFCNTNSCSEISVGGDKNCMQKYGCSTSSVDQCQISDNCSAALLQALTDAPPTMSEIIDSFGEECVGLTNNNLVRATLNAMFGDQSQHLPELSDSCCVTNEGVFATMMTTFGYTGEQKCNNLSPALCNIFNSLKCSDGSLPKCYSESIWGEPNTGKYCANGADFVIDDNKENPDATTLGDCKTFCEQKEDCTAITYYGDTAIDGWQNKCYLSRGVCTEVDSNVNGEVYSFDRCLNETPLVRDFPPKCPDDKYIRCPNDNCKTLEPISFAGLLLAPCCNTCQSSDRTWADLGEQVNPTDNIPTNSYIIGCTQVDDCEENIGDLSVCQQECNEFWNGGICNAINYREDSGQCCMMHCEDTSNPILNFTYRDEDMGQVDANTERLKWQKWVRNDVFPEEIEACPTNHYWQKPTPDSIFKVSECVQCPEKTTQSQGRCTQCIDCCNEMPLKNPDGSVAYTICTQLEENSFAFSNHCDNDMIESVHNYPLEEISAVGCSNGDKGTCFLCPNSGKNVSDGCILNADGTGTCTYPFHYSCVEHDSKFYQACDGNYIDITVYDTAQECESSITSKNDEAGECPASTQLLCKQSTSFYNPYVSSLIEDKWEEVLAADNAEESDFNNYCFLGGSAGENSPTDKNPDDFTWSAYLKKNGNSNTWENLKVVGTQAAKDLITGALGDTTDPTDKGIHYTGQDNYNVLIGWPRGTVTPKFPSFDFVNFQTAGYVYGSPGCGAIRSADGETDNGIPEGCESPVFGDNVQISGSGKNQCFTGRVNIDNDSAEEACGFWLANPT